MNEVLLLPTGSANLASVRAALERAGARPRLAEDPLQLERAPYVVVPGVGAFGAAAEALQRDTRNALRRRVERGDATLGICLGMQLFCASSAESPGARGLGLVTERVEPLPPAPRTPQLGWNRVVPTCGARHLREGHAYFANGYALPRLPEHWEGALFDHGGPFVAALELGKVLLCQFHPELSGDFGATLLRAWLEGGARC